MEAGVLLQSVGKSCWWICLQAKVVTDLKKKEEKKCCYLSKLKCQ